MEIEKNERIEKLLALILLSQLKGNSNKEKISQLNIAGFSNLEIADLLETKSNLVAQLLYEAKKGKKKKPKAKNTAN